MSSANDNRTGQGVTLYCMNELSVLSVVCLVFWLEHGIKLKSSDLFYEVHPRVTAARWVEHYASKHSPIADQREKAECLMRWMQKYSKLGTFVCLRTVLCKPLLHNLLSDGQDWKEFCCHDINIKTNVCKHLVSTSSWFFHQNILSCLEHALLLDLMDVKGMTSSCWGIRIIKHFHFCRSKNFTHNRMGARQHFCCIVNIFKRLAYNIKRLHTTSYTILLHAMKLIQLQGVQCNGSSNSLIRISSGIGN